jgi:hypothetical protein
LGCSSESESVPTVTTDPFVARAGVLYDDEGRELILRGVNARVDRIFDVSFDDGREPLEPIPPFGKDDCRFIGEDLGMNHLRLPVNWSRLEPTKGSYDAAYVDEILALAAACNAHGVKTLVDLHQDAYSKEIGEDGAPLWAIVPPPEQLLGGPLTDLAERRTSAQVLNAFDSFFNDAEGVQAAYAAMAAWLGERIEGAPGVIGLELMNEPVLILFEFRLDDFHDRVGAAVRQKASTLTLFFEPNSTRNLFDRADVRRPVAFDDAIYAPHLYVDVFEEAGASTDATAVDESVRRITEEGQAIGGTPYVGEFGAAPDEPGRAYSRLAYETLDRYRISAAFWVYEEWAQGQWGLYETTISETRGPLRPSMVELVARPYPAAIAGKLKGFDFDAATKTLTVEVSDATDSLHVLAAPKALYPDGVHVTCDGADVEATAIAGRVEVKCLGTQLVLSPSEETR